MSIPINFRSDARRHGNNISKARVHKFLRTAYLPYI